MKQEQIEVLTPEYLGNFIGTEKYYRYGLLGNLLLTDGAHHCAKNGLCWFFDIIGSMQHLPKVRRESFQSWVLEKYKTSDSFLVTCTDGNDNKLYSQRIEYSDYPFLKFSVFAQKSENKIVVMLPSEY